MLNKDQCMTHGRRRRRISTGSLQSLRNVHRDEKFVFGNEDPAPSECWMFHGGPMHG